MNYSEIPETPISLYIQGRNLANMDTFSKSDPQVFVYLKQNKLRKQNEYQGIKNESEWELIGKTEIIQDNLNPIFSESIALKYRFEEVQTLRFDCYDIDYDSANLEDQDFIGRVECSVGTIMGARGSRLMKQLKSPENENRGSLIISGEEVRENNSMVTLEINCTKLNRTGWFTHCHPFLRISRMRENRNFDAVYSSAALYNTVSPSFPTVEMSVQKLCNSDHNRNLNIEVIHKAWNGNETIIGSHLTTLNKLLDVSPDVGDGYYTTSLEVEADLKKEESGILRCHTRVQQINSFLDYVRGGMEINLMLGIDFTGSNGDPSTVDSLHFRSSVDNEYQSAIKSVCNVLCPYDTDHLFPCYGFGAKVAGLVKHCFHLNGNPDNPEIYGIQGILHAYDDCLNNVKLWGPTNFAPIIKTASQYAQKAQNDSGQSYMILLMITDGVISDLNNTIDEIVNASKLPLSIVIVGVGDADFGSMDLLDADDEPLRHSRTNGLMTRDIVQFVPFRDCKNNPAEISKMTLQEIPTQVLSYFESKGIDPNPPVYVDDGDLKPSFTNPVNNFPFL